MDNSGNISTLKQRINEVRVNKLLFLDLSGMQLSEIPEDISDLDFIMELDLSWNHFTSIPS